MLQRIQSVYLLLVTVLGTVGIFLAGLFSKGEDGNLVFAEKGLLITVLLAVSVLGALITIFLFKNRKLQFVLNRLNIILNFILLGVFVYRSQTLPGGMDFSEKGIWMLLPLISIVFLALANKAIKKDEDLVKSVDRLR